MIQIGAAEFTTAVEAAAYLCKLVNSRPMTQPQEDAIQDTSRLCRIAGTELTSPEVIVAILVGVQVAGFGHPWNSD